MWRNGVRRGRVGMMGLMVLLRIARLHWGIRIDLGSWDRVIESRICIFRYHGEC